MILYIMANEKYYCDFVPQIEGNDTTPIIERFFFTLSVLRSEGILRGVQSFTTLYNINRRNLLRLRSDIVTHQRGFDPAWLSYLVRDFKVSPLWLLTGDGEVFREGWTPDTIRIYRRAVTPRKEQKKSKAKIATS